jgi:protein-L-isoaspartate(D-aspartate) O-methyltransferase
LEKYQYRNAKVIRAGAEPGQPGERYDKILVSASARDLPQGLVKQLEIGGRMVIPVQSSIYSVDRISEKEIEETEYYGFSFVPLIY